MAQSFSGSVEIQNTAGEPTTRIVLVGDEGAVRLHGPAGEIASTVVAGKFVHVGATPAKRPKDSSKPLVLRPPTFGGGAAPGPTNDPAVSTKDDPKVWLRVGDDKLAGGVFVAGPSGRPVIRLNGTTGSLGVGGEGQDGDIVVLDAAGVLRVRINGRTGDIELSGADCAEEFDAEVELRHAEPGSVMSIGDSGGVRPCDRAFDPRVAGIVSGAGSHHPAIILDKTKASGPRVALALTGKAFCKVDATLGPVRTGDLLTSSATAGHAMTVGAQSPPPGCVIGKALAPMAEGIGLIPVLIALR